MSTATDEERTHAQACYAVAMHLQANRTINRAWLAIAVVGIAAAAVFQNLWYIGGAIVLATATYFYVTQSCVRSITRQTGMSPDLQALFSRNYKTNADFARDVDKLASGPDN